MMHSQDICTATVDLKVTETKRVIIKLMDTKIEFLFRKCLPIFVILQAWLSLEIKQMQTTLHYVNVFCI